MYCQPASTQYILTLRREGHSNATFYAKKPLGSKSIAKFFKESAVILSLGPDFKPYYPCGACIAALANYSYVSLAATILVACHTSAASKGYQQVDGISEGNRLCALGCMSLSTRNSAEVCGRSRNVPRKRRFKMLDDL